MAEIIEETIVTKGVVKNNPAISRATDNQTTEYIVYFLFGVLESALAFRILFKLAGASVNSSFVRFIYGLSGMFMLPFEGIFRRGFAQGIETTAVIEPSSLVAILVYAVLSWGVVRIIRILSREVQVD